jgi:predicted transcriptional regulator
LEARLEQHVRASIHRRGDIVNTLVASLEDGLQHLSQFAHVRRRRKDPTRRDVNTSIRLDVDLLARLDAACQQLEVPRSALLEAMVAAKFQPLPAPRTQNAGKTTTCLHLDPPLEQHFRQLIHRRGDVSRVITDIIQVGLAASDRFAHVRRRPPGAGRRPYQRLVITVETALFAQLTQLAQRIGTSRTALLEAMIAARLQGEI